MHAPAAARPQVPFEGTSSYHDAYHPHQLEARAPVHVEPYKGEVHWYCASGLQLKAEPKSVNQLEAQSQ